MALTIAAGTIVLDLPVAPGTGTGAAVFAALDRDSDGALDDAGMRLFAAEVLSRSSLTVDALGLEPKVTAVNRPDRERLEAGHARVAIEARVKIDLSASRENRFAIHYDAFAEDWTVQPWLAQGALPGNQVPAITRGAANGSVTISFPNRGP